MIMFVMIVSSGVFYLAGSRLLPEVIARVQL